MKDSIINGLCDDIVQHTMNRLFASYKYFFGNIHDGHRKDCDFDLIVNENNEIERIVLLPGDGKSGVIHCKNNNIHCEDGAAVILTCDFGVFRAYYNNGVLTPQFIAVASDDYKVIMRVTSPRENKPPILFDSYQPGVFSGCSRVSGFSGFEKSPDTICHRNSRRLVHRLDGPAHVAFKVDGGDDKHLYYINGDEYTYNQYVQSPLTGMFRRGLRNENSIVSDVSL